MKQPTWLLEKFVLAAHHMVLAEHGGPGGVRDSNLLESALAKPRNKYAYEPETSIHSLAAAYSHGITMNHPFVDGNKRTALIAGLVFLEINGINFGASEAETVAAFETLASGKLSEADLGRWFAEHCR